MSNHHQLAGTWTWGSRSALFLSPAQYTYIIKGGISG